MLIEVVHERDRWEVLVDGELGGSFSTRSAAEHAGRATAEDMQADLFIYGEDGNLVEKQYASGRAWICLGWNGTCLKDATAGGSRQSLGHKS